MNKFSITLLGTTAIALLAACKSDKTAGESTVDPDSLQPTAEIQKALTPDAVLEILIKGNGQFVEGNLLDVDVLSRRNRGVEGQFPKAYILSCVDSRVPVEKVFNLSIGDLFVGRVAGNVETTGQLGSMEFAAGVSGVKVIMVLGHEACGAVKGACDMPELGNMTNLANLLGEIQPSVKDVPGHDGARDSKNEAFVNEVIKQNVLNTVAQIRERSPALAALEKEGKIKIVGGLYALGSGKVELLN